MLLIYVKGYDDALILFEASRLGLIKMSVERPSFKEKLEIRSGTTYIYDENETGIKRWTDGMTWTSGRLIDGFFHYSQVSSLADKFDSEPINYSQSTMENELLEKKVISLINPEGHIVHLVNYYAKDQSKRDLLVRPTQLNYFTESERLELAFKYKQKSSSRSSSYSDKNNQINETTDKKIVDQVDKYLNKSPTKQTNENDFAQRSGMNRSLASIHNLDLQTVTSPTTENAIYDEDNRQKELLKQFISF